MIAIVTSSLPIVAFQASGARTCWGAYCWSNRLSSASSDGSAASVAPSGLAASG